MLSAFKNIAVYFLFFILLFVVSRCFFVLYHFDKLSNNICQIPLTFLYGIRLDISATCYILLVSFLLLIANAFIKSSLLLQINKYYHYLIIVIIALINTFDLQLYNVWGTKLNATAFDFLFFPREVAGSLLSTPLWFLIPFFIFQVVFGIAVYRRFLKKQASQLTNNVNTGNFLFVNGGLFLLYSAFFILGIRGGWQLSPINQSAVYFSGVPVLNHTALNTSWNFFFSIIRQNQHRQNPYTYFNESYSKSSVQALYADTCKTNMQVLNNTQPNIMLVILEGFTADIIKSLGGEKNVTPNFEELVKEGLLFSNIYANGDRTYRGIVSILSAFPTQPNTPIINEPEKTEKLPSLNKTLINNNYTTRFYYGGESEFANIKSYLLNTGYTNIIDKNNFDKKDWNAKWGAHDHVVFNKVISDLQTQPTPFFCTVLTLSSHEPFDVPMNPIFTQSHNEADLFRNSAAYTDKSLADFIKNAKKQPWYNNTLFIFIADHGNNLPKYYNNNYFPNRHKIPMLWFGNVLNKEYMGKIIPTIGSQNDLANTLFSQMQLPTTNFEWSKNLLQQNAKSFAFYVFGDGVGCVYKQNRFAFDNLAQQVIYNDSLNIDTTWLNMAKAYMQYSFTTFLNIDKKPVN